MTTPNQSQIRNVSENGVLKIYLLQPKLSEDHLVENVAAEITTLLNQSSDKRVIISFRDVAFMGSAMIGKLVHLNKRCMEDGLDFRVCEMNENLTEVMNLMRLDKLINIHESEQAALEA